MGSVWQAASLVWDAWTCALDVLGCEEGTVTLVEIYAQCTTC